MSIISEVDQIVDPTTKPIVDFFNNLRGENLDKGLTKEKDIFKTIKNVLKSDEHEINYGYKNGPERTQHGVNAEHICIAEANAAEIRAAMKEGREAVLMKKSPAVNGPDDMIRGDEIYQAKYYQTAKGSLEGCLDHLEKYSDRYANNSKAFYVIPNEQYDVLMAIKNGEIPEGFTPATAGTLRRKIAQFESLKGESIESSVRGGGVTYEKAHQEYNQESNAARRRRLKKEHKKEEQALKEKYSPNAVECVKTSLAAAGIAGGLTAAFDIYQRHTEGKNIFLGEYDEEDYKSLGRNVLSSSGSAALSAGALYWMSVAMKKHAGFASVLLNLGKSLLPIKLAFARGEISFNEFVGCSCSVTMTLIAYAAGDAGVSAMIATAVGLLGGAGITVPGAGVVIAGIIGSIVGSIVIGKLIELADGFINRDVHKLMDMRTAFINELIHDFNIKLEAIEKEFDISFSLATTVGDLSLSVEDRLSVSNKLAAKYGTDPVETNPDVDALRKRFFQK